VSEQNVELHRSAIAAYNARDVEAMVAVFDPSIEFHPGMAVGSSVYHGHEGARRWHQDLGDVWGERIRIEPEAYFDLGEQTLLFYALHGRGRQSGAEVEMRNAAHVFRWRDSLIVYWKGYFDRRDALRDLGIAEDTLEPIAP
jgi:ketosteroid isomerase-like protein